MSARGEMPPEPSLGPTRCAGHRLAAPGHRGHCPSAASRRPPPRLARFERLGGAGQSAQVPAAASSRTRLSSFVAQAPAPAHAQVT